MTFEDFEIYQAPAPNSLAAENDTYDYRGEYDALVRMATSMGIPYTILDVEEVVMDVFFGASLMMGPDKVLKAIRNEIKSNSIGSAQ